MNFDQNRGPKPLFSCLKWQVFTALESKDFGLFAFLAAVGRLCSGIKVPTGTWDMMGFGVIESPVGIIQRMVKGFKVERLLIDSTDAPMLWLRRALKLVNS